MTQKRILVVDDDLNVCRIVAKVAEDHGVSVTTVHDGATVPQVWKQFGPFDMVVLDLVMPHVCGWEVLDLIRRDSAAANTRVVILSGTPMSRKEKAALSDENTLLMSKSTFKVAELGAIMRELPAGNTEREEQDVPY